MKAKKVASLLLASALAISMLAGCASGGQTSSPAPAQEAVPAAEQQEEAPAEEAESSKTEAAVDLGTQTAETIQSEIIDVINVGIETDPGEFTPFGAANGGKTACLWGLYEPLAEVIDGEIYGVLAKNCEIMDDNQSISFELYDYIHDQAGNPMTASDVKFSVEKAQEIGKLGAVKKIDSVEVTGDYTGIIKMKNELANGDLDEALSKWFVVTEAAYNASDDEMAFDPCGTGSYKLSQYTSGYIATYEKYDDYWQTDASLINPREMANVNTINYYIIAEKNQMTVALEQGTIDQSSAVSADDLYRFEEGGELSDKYWVYNNFDNLSMDVFLNCAEGKPTQDLNLRNAIYRAINSEAVLQSVYSGRGATQHDIAPSWAVGYNPEWDNADDYYTYDPAKAKEYLDQSGYNGEELVIICEGTQAATNTATLIQTLLQQIGIKTTISTIESSVYTTYREDPDVWDIMVVTYATNVYATNGWDMVFSKDRFAWGGTINFVQDEKLQEMLKEASMLSTGTQEKVDELHQYIIDNAYGMALVNFQISYVVPDWMDQVTLSYKKSPIVGGCTYTAK